MEFITKSPGEQNKGRSHGMPSINHVRHMKHLIKESNTKLPPLSVGQECESFYTKVTFDKIKNFNIKYELIKL